MSGLFLNFYQINIDIPEEDIKINFVDYNLHSSKDQFLSLKQKYPDYHFYRLEDKFIIWNNQNELIEDFEVTEINMLENSRLVSKFLENSLIDYLIKSLKQGYEIYKKQYEFVWEILKKEDVLISNIPGLTVNRVIKYSPYYFYKNDNLFFGFTLSTYLKHKFDWDIREFEEKGIDIKGLRQNEKEVFANSQSLKRFFEATGTKDKYESIIKKEKTNQKSFDVINKFYNWLNKHIGHINLPFGLKINNIKKRYIPFEDGIINSEIIWKPERYFYSNRKNIKKLRFYDEMVREYFPYSYELFLNKELIFGVICPKEYQGETEGFIKKLEVKIKEDFHLTKIKFILKSIEDSRLENYKKTIYDDDLKKCDLVYVVVTQFQKDKLSPNNSPYYVTKAKLIGLGIPTQDIKIETIRNLNKPTMTNIALNTYAKIGGTAWTIEREEKLCDELIIGIGSTISKYKKYVLGIAQIFHNDGRYIAGDVSPLSTFDNYSTNLENHLFETLKPLIDNFYKLKKFRLIFHLFKSASEKYEIEAINKLQERFNEYSFEFALVHLGYGHNFRFYFNDGRNSVKKGTYVQLSSHTALLHFVENSDLPLKIELDKRSTFKSLFYISKQIFWFSHLSHRSYSPAKKTITIMYPSLMAKITEALKQVDDWDYDRLEYVKEKLWFI